tara:strand:+ start:5727 stop:6311 length:585 start_codon:yes stop_codon:yes gene_type:complete
MANYPEAKILNSGHRVVPYYYKGIVNSMLEFEDWQACDNAILQLQEERDDDRLSDNYCWKGLHLDKMFLYNVVFYKDTYEPILVSGAQSVGENSVRVFSRYYAFEKYRTDGTQLLEKVDNFDELRYTLEYCKKHDLVFWSRDKSNKFFKRLKKGRPDIFSNWEVHPDKIEIIYPDNEQYIFYRGNINEILYNRN